MIQQLSGEHWKEVQFDFDRTNDIKIEISNYGRVRSTTPQNGITILKGAMVNGYRIIRLKFFKKREPAEQKRMDYIRGQIAALVRETGKMRTRNKAKKVKDKSYYDYERKIQEQTELLEGLKKKYRKEFRASELKRTINYGGLVHRIVAEYFVEKPLDEHSLVAHLDYNKLNNRSDNLQWMTREENVQHQKNSPYVLHAKKERFGKRFEGSKVCKLTSTKVMLIKKELNKGVPLKRLAKVFKVSEMQLSRIKRGENWGDIQPAA